MCSKNTTCFPYTYMVACFGTFMVLLRNYPPRFGKRLARLHPKFCASRELWEPHQNVEGLTGQTLFDLLEWGDLWEDGDMVTTLAWLRGNKHLELGPWRDSSPTHM